MRASYRVGSGRLVVRARSSIHDTQTTWDTIAGEIELDPDALAEDGATASFTVDMTSFDAGDWLKNRKLKKDFALAAHPRATFTLTGLRDVVREPSGAFRAVATGVLGWRGRELELEIAGTGRADAKRVDATGRFELDIRELGLEPPRFLMFKVDSEVTVEVSVAASVG